MAAEGRERGQRALCDVLQRAAQGSSWLAPRPPGQPMLVSRDCSISMRAGTDSYSGSAAPEQQAADCWKDKEQGGHDPINCLRIITAAPSGAFAALDSRQQRRLLDVNLQRLLPLQIRQAEVAKGSRRL